MHAFTTHNHFEFICSCFIISPFSSFFAHHFPKQLTAISCVTKTRSHVDNFSLSNTPCLFLIFTFTIIAILSKQFFYKFRYELNNIKKKIEKEVLNTQENVKLSTFHMLLLSDKRIKRVLLLAYIFIFKILVEDTVGGPKF